MLANFVNCFLIVLVPPPPQKKNKKYSVIHVPTFASLYFHCCHTCICQRKYFSLRRFQTFSTVPTSVWFKLHESVSFTKTFPKLDFLSVSVTFIDNSLFNVHFWEWKVLFWRVEITQVIWLLSVFTRNLTKVNVYYYNRTIFYETSSVKTCTYVHISGMVLFLL